MAWDREKERRAGKALGIGGSIYGIVFVVIWCAAAAGMGAGFMLIPGLLLLGFLIFRLTVLLKKSKSETRERDPWEMPGSQPSASDNTGSGFCPYCGERLEDRFAFCPKCGRRR